MKNSTNYLYKAQVAFVKIDNGIYHVLKIRQEFQSRYGDGLTKEQYITANKVVDILNEVDKVAIFTEGFQYIHANFTLEEEEK